MSTLRGNVGGRSLLILTCFVIAVACQGSSASTAATGASSVTGANPPPSASTGVGSGCPASPIPPGIYVNDIQPSDLSKLPPSLAPGDGFVGTWKIAVGVADPHCYYGSWALQLRGNQVTFVDAHPFTVIGPNEIALHGAGEPIGTYRVSVRGGVLRYFEIHDPSVGRPEVLTIGGLWIRSSSP